MLLTTHAWPAKYQGMTTSTSHLQGHQHVAISDWLYKHWPQMGSIACYCLKLVLVYGIADSSSCPWVCVCGLGPRCLYMQPTISRIKGLTKVPYHSNLVIFLFPKFGELKRRNYNLMVLSSTSIEFYRNEIFILIIHSTSPNLFSSTPISLFFFFSFFFKRKKGIKIPKP